VPFAECQDNDDVVCWDVPTGEVVVVHDYGDSDRRDRLTFENFYAWLRQAVEDLIGWDW
jgi:hypothetical protein